MFECVKRKLVLGRLYNCVIDNDDTCAKCLVYIGSNSSNGSVFAIIGECLHQVCDADKGSVKREAIDRIKNGIRHRTIHICTIDNNIDKHLQLVYELTQTGDKNTTITLSDDIVNDLINYANITEMSVKISKEVRSVSDVAIYNYQDNAVDDCQN